MAEKRKKSERKQKGQKAAEQNQRIKKYKSEQQTKKKGKKPRTYQNNRMESELDQIIISLVIILGVGSAIGIRLWLVFRK